MYNVGHLGELFKSGHSVTFPGPVSILQVLEKLLSRPKGKPAFFEVVLGAKGQSLHVDALLGEDLGILGQVEFGENLLKLCQA